jgi:glycerol-3-phosphate acyltransferase PlsY
MPPKAEQLGVLIVLAYLLGSVPFGLIVAKTKGVDPRQHGSGNIGATNVARALGGKKWFFLIFVLDALKGALPMLAAAYLLHGSTKGPGTYALWLAAGLAAIFGHMFSIFLKFKGGKGVATSAGVMFGLWPYYTLPGVAALTIFVAVFMAFRYVSLASIVAAVSVPVTYVLIGLARRWPVFGPQWPLLAFATFVAGMIVWKHRANIARLKAGTEHCFDKKTT